MSQRSAQPQRILIVRPSALGDVARTVPALVSLRRAFADARIDWLVRDVFADAIAHHPDLHEVVRFPRDKWLSAIGLGLSLRGRRYDRVYDLQGLARSGLYTWASRAPRRVGMADAREGARRCYTSVHDVTEHQHTVDRMLAVLEADGVTAVRDMRLHTHGDDRAWAERFAHEHQLHEPFAVIAPTAQWLSKQWPTDRFAALADRLPELGITPAAIVGTAVDRPAAEAIVDAAGGNRRLVDATGRTSVGQLTALIERAAVVIANDSAALHLAVGLGRRCIGIFGPTDPAKVGPYRYEQAVVAAPYDGANYRAERDDRSIIAKVTVDQAWSALCGIMSAPPPTTRHDACP